MGSVTATVAPPTESNVILWFRTFGAIARSGFRRYATYRQAALAGAVTNIVFGFLRCYILFGAAGAAGTAAGYDRAQFATFVWAGQGMLAVILLWGRPELAERIRTGDVASDLLRPVHPVTSYLATDLGRAGWACVSRLLLMDLPLRKASRAVFGLAVLLVALARAGIEWTPGRVALAVAAPLAGVVFFGSVFVATATVSFYWTESGELANSVTYGGRDFTSYPVTIFDGWFRAAFAYGMGFAFVSYQPALALLGRADPLGLPAWVGWASPTVALVAAALAATAWRVGVRHYRSTGS
ncbi:ABC-2 family transporter protein [Micromonospora sp. DH15]|nr:ABC-2 family transporter protein [Micromonospora sp. DH15]